MRTNSLNFGHRPETIRFWRRQVARALRTTPAPFYLFSAAPILHALRELTAACRASPLPVRHWLSCKTQPLAPLLRWWRRRDGSIEVVSEFELLAARREKFPPARIMINGPAKHHWLPRHAEPGFTVNFDSEAELAALWPLAVRYGWRLGLRLLTRAEEDAEHPGRATQFGFEPAAALRALQWLQRRNGGIEVLHFHLRSNVAETSVYEAAVAEAAELCRRAGVQPAFLDLGGGWPPPHTVSRRGEKFAGRFHRRGIARLLRGVASQFPGLREIWLENGRFVSARGGVLVVKVLEEKRRRGWRQLICNGGRTLHAMVSLWEEHALLPLERRRGRAIQTAVHGPTCMAFDQLACRRLPADIGPGDHLIWFDAGAYHVPWETAFSHGRAAILWHEAGPLELVRAPQTFEDWWAGLGASPPGFSSARAQGMAGAVGRAKSKGCAGARSNAT